jgi:hypothetical protein
MYFVARKCTNTTVIGYLQPANIEQMEIRELFGRTITQVYCEYGLQDGWLDTADCIIELDKKLFVGFPFTPDGVWVGELPEVAKPIFWSDGREEPVIGRIITDFLWFEDDDYGGYFLLNDGSLIHENRMSPHGTGQAGLHHLASVEALRRDDGVTYKQLTALEDSSR